MGLEPGSVSRRCHLLSLQPTVVVGITQRWINTKIQFCCSCNLETYHRIYLWVISVSFLHFQSLLRFMKSQFSVTSSLLMKSSFLKNLSSFLRFLIKSVIHILISSKYCVSHHLWLMSHLLPYCCQIYVCANSYQLVNVPDRK